METMLTVSRYHDISAGHRVVGHEGKCQSFARAQLQNSF